MASVEKGGRGGEKVKILRGPPPPPPPGLWWGCYRSKISQNPKKKKEKKFTRHVAVVQHIHDGRFCLTLTEKMQKGLRNQIQTLRKPPQRISQAAAEKQSQRQSPFLSRKQDLRRHSEFLRK